LWTVVVVVDEVVVVDAEVAGVDAAAFELVCEAEPPPQPAIANPATIVLSNAFFIDKTPVRSDCSALRLQDTPGAETFRRRRRRKGSGDPLWPFRRRRRRDRGPALARSAAGARVIEDPRWPVPPPAHA
jgi:hypothetical protein